MGFAPFQYRLGATGLFAAKNTFINLTPATYKVYVKDDHGCINFYNAIIAQSGLTCFAKEIIAKGEQKTMKLEVAVFPNPTTNQFTLLAHTANREAIQVRVMDINGRMVYQQKCLPEQTVKFGAAFISGMYLVEVRQGKEVKTLKAIKIK